MSLDELAQHQYERLLYARAVHLMHCSPDAWDLVQDTFEHALRGYDSFQPGSNLRVWLMTIMQHLFIDRCRRKAREPWVEAIDEELVATVEPEITTKPEWATISDEQVADALQELESPFREVYTLRLLDKCSYDEIAARLLIPRSTVGTRLMRARKKLQQNLRRRASGAPASVPAAAPPLASMTAPPRPAAAAPARPAAPPPRASSAEPERASAAA